MEIIEGLLETEQKNGTGKNISSKLIEQIERIIERRLKQMTSVQVKDIVQRMIREHLGWMVVWGGFLGVFLVVL